MIKSCTARYRDERQGDGEYELSNLLCFRVPDVVHHFISRGKIDVLCIHKSLPPTIYWT